MKKVNVLVKLLEQMEADGKNAVLKALGKEDDDSVTFEVVRPYHVSSTEDEDPVPSVVFKVSFDATGEELEKMLGKEGELFTAEVYEGITKPLELVIYAVYNSETTAITFIEGEKSLR